MDLRTVLLLQVQQIDNVCSFGLYLLCKGGQRNARKPQGNIHQFPELGQDSTVCKSNNVGPKKVRSVNDMTELEPTFEAETTGFC